MACAPRRCSVNFDRWWRSTKSLGRNPSPTHPIAQLCALSSSGSLLSPERWLNIDLIRLLVHHASAMVAAVLVFAGVGRLVVFLMPHGAFRRVVVIIDDIVLTGLMAWFGWELFVYLWNRREKLGAIHHSAPAMLAAARLWLPAIAHAIHAGIICRG